MAKILHEANKIVTLFNKPVINGYGFPIISEHAITLCEIECQNFEKFTYNLFKVPLKADPHHQAGGRAIHPHQEGDSVANE